MTEGGPVDKGLTSSRRDIPVDPEIHLGLVLALYTADKPVSEIVRILSAAERPLSFDEVVDGLADSDWNRRQLSYKPRVKRPSVKGLLAWLSHGGVVEVDRQSKKRRYSIAPAFRLDIEPVDEFRLGLKDVSQKIQTVADLRAVLGVFGIQDVLPSGILQVVDEVAQLKDQRLKKLDDDISKYIKSPQPDNT